MRQTKPGFDAPHPLWVEWGLVPAVIAAIAIDTSGERGLAGLTFALLAIAWAVPTTIWRRRHRSG